MKVKILNDEYYEFFPKDTQFPLEAEATPDYGDLVIIKGAEIVRLGGGLGEGVDVTDERELEFPYAFVIGTDVEVVE